MRSTHQQQVMAIITALDAVVDPIAAAGEPFASTDLGMVRTALVRLRDEPEPDQQVVRLIDLTDQFTRLLGLPAPARVPQTWENACQAALEALHATPRVTT